MAGFTVGSLVAYLQLRSEQFESGVTQAQGGLRSLASGATSAGERIGATEAEMAGLGATAGRTSATLRTTSGELVRNAGATGDLAAQNSRLQAAELRLIAAQERYNAAMASGRASTAQLATAEATLVSSQQRVVDASAGVTAALRTQSAEQAAAARAAVASAETQGGAMASLATKTEGFAASVSRWGKLLGGVGLIIGVAEIAKQGNEFTHAMNTLAAASGGTAEQLAAARAQAIAMGKDLTIPKVSATDAAVAMEDLVKAGVSLERAMAAARPALLLAAAANVDVADSARVVGDILDEYQLSASQAGHVSNIMAAAANSAGGGLMDLFQALKYVGPPARQAGVSIDWTTAALVELAKAGIQGSLAGTSLRNTLTRLNEKAAGAPAAAALKDLGIQAFDATGKFKGLPAVFDQLHAAQERLDPQTFAADVSIAFGSRALAAVEIFAHGGSEKLQGFYDKLEQGDVQKFADKMNRGLGAGFAQLGKEAQAFGLDIYNAVTPRLSEVVDWIGTNLPRAVDEMKAILGPAAQAVAGAFGAAWGGAVAVLRVVGGVLGAVGGFLKDHAEVVGFAAKEVAIFWGVWKGYQIVTAAMVAIRGAAASMSASVGGSLQTVRASWSSLQASGTLTSLQLQADMEAAAAADLEWQAAAERNAAAQAEAYAVIVAASDDATATMVANSANAARAATAQAEATTAAYTEMAAAATASSEAVVVAGETAAIGWRGLLGPIGLVVGALAFVTLGFRHSGDSAKDAVIGVDAFTSAIEKDSGALGTNTKAAVANQLAKDGAFAAANKLGIGTDVLTNAVLKGGTALASLKSRLTDAAAAYNATTDGANAAGMSQRELTDYSHALDAAFGGNGKAAQDLLDELNGVSGGLKDAQTNAANMSTALDTGTAASAAQAAQVEQLQNVVGAYAGASDAAGRSTSAGLTASLALSVAQQGLEEALSGTKTAADGLKTALDAMNGHMNADQAQNSFLDQLDQLTKGFQDNGASIEQADAKGRANRETLLSGIDAAQKAAEAQSALTGNVQDGIDVYQANIDKLFAQAAAAGVNSGELDTLKQSVVNLPALKQILIDAQADTASAVINNIKTQIASIPTKISINITPTLTRQFPDGTVISGTSRQIGAGFARGGYVGRGLAAGGFGTFDGLVSGPGSATSDTAGLFPLSTTEFVQKGAAVNKTGVPFQEAVNRGDLSTAAGILAGKGYGARGGDGAVAAPVRSVSIVNHLTGWERREVAAYNQQQLGPAI